MTIRAVQQFQLRQELGTEAKAKKALQAMKDAGYEGIELNGFMIHKMSFGVRMLCSMAGMPIGSSGTLDWHRLVSEMDLKVVSLHEYLDGLLKEPQPIIEEAKAFGTKNIVITGMRKFDYSIEGEVLALAKKLNRAGETIAESGLNLLYHNHNCEFRRLATGQTAFELLIEATDPRYVNFEFDSYWATEAGCDVPWLMHQLGSRMKLYHINDRGTRIEGPTNSILKSDSIELGYGNINLVNLVDIAKSYAVESIILESHQNWAEKSAIKSLQLSAEFMNKYV